MVDRDPVEPRAEVARGLIHELAAEATQASELARFVRRDDEPEMMPIVFAALCKGPAVCLISGRIEEFARRSVAGDAVALQIAEMGSQAAGRPHPAHDARLDHGAAAAPLQEPRCGEARGAPTPEPATMTAAATRETAGLLCGVECLRQEGPCPGGARRANSAWTDAEIVVTRHLARRRGAENCAPPASCRITQVVRGVRNVCRVFGICLCFLPQPTDRTLRLLSCPRRSLVPGSHFPSLRVARTRGVFRQNPLPLIAIDPPLIGLRTGRPAAASASTNQPSTDRSAGVLDAYHVQFDRQRTRRLRAQ
jgi:hypothetical protein